MNNYQKSRHILKVVESELRQADDNRCPNPS